MRYRNTLTSIIDSPPILADYPQYIEPLQAEKRFLAPPIVNDEGGRLLVRSWRYWYNPRGIVEFENWLDAAATAVMPATAESAVPQPHCRRWAGRVETRDRSAATARSADRAPVESGPGATSPRIPARRC